MRWFIQYSRRITWVDWGKLVCSGCRKMSCILGRQQDLEPFAIRTWRSRQYLDKAQIVLCFSICQRMDFKGFNLSFLLQFFYVKAAHIGPVEFLILLVFDFGVDATVGGSEHDVFWNQCPSTNMSLLLVPEWHDGIYLWVWSKLLGLGAYLIMIAKIELCQQESAGKKVCLIGTAQHIWFFSDPNLSGPEVRVRKYVSPKSFEPRSRFLALNHIYVSQVIPDQI